MKTYERVNNFAAHRYHSCIVGLADWPALSDGLLCPSDHHVQVVVDVLSKLIHKDLSQLESKIVR
jgi:hypothetical protein